MEDAQPVTMSPLRKPAWKSSYASALTNQRHDQLSGGNERMARLLKAASVTTSAGSNKKRRRALTVTPPSARRSGGDGKRGISVRPDFFERGGGGAYQRQHRECEHEPGDRQARRKREVKAREAELIDQVRNHVDPAAADELRGRERAEGPGEGGGDAGDDAGRGERKRHGEKDADRARAEARSRALVVAIDVGERRRQH